MRKKMIARCTPSLGAVPIWWAQACESLQWPNNTGKAVINCVDTVGGEIAETRNRLVSLVLNRDTENCEMTHIFWVDDDVLVSCMALCRLLEHDRDIASGVYFTKSECPTPLIYPGRGAGHTPFVPDQVFETWGHGMGLTLVKTDVYRRMCDELNLPLDKYGNPQWYKTPGVEDATQEGGVLFVGGTEDLFWCQNAMKLGYKPLMDTSKWAYGWHYDLRRKTGFPPKQWAQYAAGKPVVWPTPDGPVTWGN